MNGLQRKLVDKVSHYHDTAPVFRIEPRPLPEVEGTATSLAQRVAGNYDERPPHTVRGKDRSEIALANGVRACAYHASGAIAVNAGFAPMQHLVGEKIDKDAMSEASVATVKHLGLDRIGASGERLAFERLWQIKAAGMNRERERGREVVCRTVGAFRRHVHDLPVWGRASVVVELAGGDRVSGVGVDWRPIAAEAVDRAKIIDPEHAARAVLADLAGRLPGGEFTDKDFGVALFSLGYLSLPKRRAQGMLTPVYVALLERRSWTTMNHVVAVAATEKLYESVARIVAMPPREAIRSKREAA